MGNFNQKIIVLNRNPFFITLMLEPWGQDYGMNPEDEFEIRAEAVDENFYFHIWHDSKFISVWAEGDREAYPYVFQNGVELRCGHNRREKS